MMATERRLIDANALAEHIKDLPTYWADAGGYYPGSMKYPDGMFCPDDIISSIDNAPTVDAVEVVHGYWIKEHLCGCEPYYLCSICGKLHDQDYNFCNNCGATMDGDSK